MEWHPLKLAYYAANCIPRGASQPGVVPGTMIVGSDDNSALRVEVVDLEEGEAEWQRAITNAGCCDPFQTLPWLRAERDCYGRRVCLFLVHDEHDVVGGQAVVTRSLAGLQAHEALGGPLASPGRETPALHAILGALQRQLPHGVYQAIRPSAPHSLGALLIGHGFRPSSLYTYLIDLGRSEQELWRSFEPRARKPVRKAERAGVEVSEAENWATWAEFLALEQSHARQHDITRFSESECRYFHEVLRPTDACRLFVARLEGRMAAGWMFIIGSGSVRGFIGCSRADMTQFSPNDLIMWHAIRWARNQGLKTLDLYDTDPRKGGLLYGIHQFKAKWGGVLVDRPYYIRGKLYYWLREWWRRSAGQGLLCRMLGGLYRL